LASADPELTLELTADLPDAAQSAAGWDAALARIEANLDATELWLDGLERPDGEGNTGAGVGQVPPAAGIPTAAASLWIRPDGLPALPKDQAERVGGLLERQLELVHRVADARTAVGGQLEAVRQVLATRAPAPGIYLDTKG
jgi:hypothetical protein